MKKNWKKIVAVICTLAVAVGLYGCGNSIDNDKTATKDSKDTKVVKIGVVGEYNDQWDTINDLLAKDKIKVELVKFTDYAAPNRALNDGEIDLNAFQHKAFLQNDIVQKKYDIVDIGDTLIAPLSIYNNTDKIKSIDDIEDGDKIAVPSDLTNGGRALKLLEAAGILECNPDKGYVPTKADITKYITKVEILEAESATLSNILPDCAAAIINGGNAFTAGLDPQKDAIFTEDVDPSVNESVPQLINVIVARTKDKDNETYKKIVDAYHTDEVEKTIKEAYKGAFICTWDGASKESGE